MTSTEYSNVSSSEPIIKGKEISCVNGSFLVNSRSGKDLTIMEMDLYQD